MDKYWNALRYGSQRTKTFLWTIILLTAAVLGCILYAVIAGSFISGILAVFFGMMDLIVSQSISFKDVDKKMPEGKEKRAIRGKDIFGSTESEEEREQEPLKKYDKESLDNIFYAYKVKEKKTKPVMIDLCQGHKISQCPAFMSKERGRIRFLLLKEEGPDEITVELNKINSITHEKGVRAEPGREYAALKKPSFISPVFLPFLPTYYETKQDGIAVTCKNRYVIEPGIRFTNTSAATVFDFLEVQFIVDDKITNSGKFDRYFIELYRNNLLWKDGVMPLKEYRSKIQTVLHTMWEELSDKQELEKNLDIMVQYRLITEEYAKYYKNLH